MRLAASFFNPCALENPSKLGAKHLCRREEKLGLLARGDTREKIFRQVGLAYCWSYRASWPARMSGALPEAVGRPSFWQNNGTRNARETALAGADQHSLASLLVVIQLAPCGDGLATLPLVDNPSSRTDCSI